MGETTCYVQRPGTDLLVHLNGRVTEGETTGFHLRGTRFADVPPTADLPRLPDGRPYVVHEFNLYAGSDADYPTLLERYQMLAEILSDDAELVWHPDAMADPTVFEIYESTIPAVFRGQERGGFWVIDRLKDQAGYTLQIRSTPRPRLPTVRIFDQQSITNAVGGFILEGENPGHAISEARLLIEVPDAAAQVVQCRVHVRSGESAAYAAAASWDIDWNDTPSVSPEWLLMDRHVITPDDPAALEGLYRVVVTLTPQADLYHVMVRAGTSLTGPQGASGADIPLDFTDIEVGGEEQTEADLGLLRYRPGDPRLVVEIWARSENNSDVADWGNVYLLPADELSAVVGSPGFRGGRYALEKYDGADLEIQGTPTPTITDDDALIIDTEDQTADIPPSGRTLPIGRHVTEPRGHAHNRDRTRAKIAELKVDNDDGPVARSSLFNRRGQPNTRFAEDDSRRVYYDVVDDTKVYREYVEHTEATTAGRWIHLEKLDHWYIPILQDGGAFELDAGTQEANLLDPDGNVVADAVATAFIEIGPGPFAIAILTGDMPPAGYDSVDQRWPIPEILDAREVLVTLDLNPREPHP